MTNPNNAGERSGYLKFTEELERRLGPIETRARYYHGVLVGWASHYFPTSYEDVSWHSVRNSAKTTRRQDVAGWPRIWGQPIADRFVKKGIAEAVAEAKKSFTRLEAKWAAQAERPLPVLRGAEIEVRQGGRL
jgi:hypothetical protein